MEIAPLLDVRTMLSPLADIPPSPMFEVGIPGLVTGDAIAQKFVEWLRAEIQTKVDMVVGRYSGQIQTWRGNNERGIYAPAPGPMMLASLDAAALERYVRTGTGGAAVYDFYEQSDPLVPPGTILKPPAPPAPVPIPDDPIGELIPGTANLYVAIGSWLPTSYGVTRSKNGHTFKLINMSPVGWFPAWLML